jgi:hypothetical protein
VTIRPRSLRGLAALPLAPFIVGGLLSYPPRTPGPQLARNGGFENGLSGWNAAGYTIDTGIFHSGKAALRLTDANLLPNSQVAWQPLPGKKGPGFYHLTAWMRTQNLGANGPNKGVRIGLRGKEGPGENYCSRGCQLSDVYSGTRDWFKVDMAGIYLYDTTNGIVLISDAYGEPSGTYWLDDVEVREEQQPLDVFLRVPNYRGILWSDRPQVAEFDVTPKAAGTITAVVSSDSGQSQVFSVEAGRLRLGLDSLGGNLLSVSFRLNDRPAFPPFALVRRPASERDTMTVTFSADGRFLVRGKPTFLLGVYDSGLGYTNSEARWESIFATERRLFELPGLNAYLNYWFGSAPLTSMQGMMNVLGRHGVLYWQTANCSGHTRYGNGTGFPGTAPDPSYAATLGRHPWLGGWYLADECVPALADTVSGDNQLLQQRDPDGVTLGVFDYPTLEPWRSSIDVLGVDKYPLYGAEPSGGYPLGQVYEWSAAVHRAGGDVRPFWQVIQFFQFTSKGRWPTQQELRSMSYAAIVGGANGLFYWSLGARALAYTCHPTSAWCPARVDYFNRLRSVFAELSSFTALANEDLPASTVTTSDPAIKIRVKKGSGKTRYFILAYNHSPHARTATLTPSAEPAGIPVSDIVALYQPWETQVFAVK